MDTEKELIYLREKVALLERIIELERLLREAKAPTQVTIPKPQKPSPDAGTWIVEGASR